jgi:predicted nucleic acid-binding protein
MTKVEQALEGVRRLALDTAPLIYLVERHPEFGAPVRDVIAQAEKGVLTLCTSTITLAEVLTQPFQLGANEIADQYEAILTNTPYLELKPVDAETARLAANLRARYRLKTPDALQIAVGLKNGCEAFLTNDGNLARVTDLKVLVVSNLTD